MVTLSSPSYTSYPYPAPGNASVVNSQPVPSAQPVPSVMYSTSNINRGSSASMQAAASRYTTPGASPVQPWFYASAASATGGPSVSALTSGTSFQNTGYIVPITQPRMQPSPAVYHFPHPMAPATPVTQPMNPALASASNVSPSAFAPTPAVPWNNNLKQLFQNRQAVIYLLHLRTFGAEDRNHDGKISPELGESGSFLSAIPHLDELAALGVNTIHMLPVHPIGKKVRLGEAGSPYAPSDMHQLNPEYASPWSNQSLLDQARTFIAEAHKRGISVMADVPSCASVDLADKRPDLIAKDLDGNLLTPTNWVDVRMFENNSALVDYYQGFFDLMANQVGVDGFRVDIARARPPWFWQHFIQQYPKMAWLGETYTTEDASPLKNLPRDIPEPLLVSGFDAIYGQNHITHSMKNADEYMRYLVDTNAMLKRTGVGKSLIGSMVTHDDPSLMTHGGVTQCLLNSGLMAFQPFTNPYIMDGFTTGYEKPFDIFTFNHRPTGRHPEIGTFLKQALDLRKKYQELVTQGVFIPIPVYRKVGSQFERSDNNQIIAYALHKQGKTLLVVANKDVNARQEGTLYVPGLKIPVLEAENLPMKSVLASPGGPSSLTVGRNKLQVSLGPGRFHVLEMDTPELPTRLQSYW